MKKDRQKLEDNLNLVLQDYANDNKVISEVTDKLIEKGISRGRIIGIFTQAIPLSYIPQTELCLFTKYFYDVTHEYKITPEEFFNESEFQQAELSRPIGEEKTNKMILHNVDQITEDLWLCSIEPYQGVNKNYSNGLWTYNRNTQRQPLKRKYGDRILEVINVEPKKIIEIEDLMLKNTFEPNAIRLNVRYMTGLEKIKYDSKDRTLIVEKDENTFIDIIDGMHRVGAMLRVVEKKPDIKRVTSIYIHHVTEERALEIIRQEQKSTPINEEYLNIIDTTNPNMEIVKAINKRQRMNEMFNRIGSNNELKSENKLVTFDTLSKTIEYVYNLKDKPVIEAKSIENFLIETFNICIGIHRDLFNEKLSETREISYVADNNTFIGYIALGEALKEKYPEEWQQKIQEILQKVNFSKPSDMWKSFGLENNLNLSTIKKISQAFRELAV